MSDIVERLRDPLRYASKDPVCKEAADEIERLRAECLQLSHAEAEAMSVVLSQEGTIERLRAELAIAKRDANRYRWIRDNHEVSGRAMEIVYGMNGSDWDSAIDAALGREGK